MLERDMFETGSGPLAVIPIHHATLAFEWDGQSVYCDPVGGAERFESLESPTLIVLTHHHGDHFDIDTIAALAHEDTRIVAPAICAEKLPPDLKARTRVMANGDSATVQGIALVAVPMYNTTPERAKYHEKGVGNGYVLDFGGTRVYLASDTEPTEDMRGLGPVDIAFFPMNLPYTMTPDQVADCVARVGPKAVYPFHYRFPFDRIGTEPDALVPLIGKDSGTQVRVHDWYRDI